MTARCAPRTRTATKAWPPSTPASARSPPATRRSATPCARRPASGSTSSVPDESVPEVSVMASGNLGIISFPREPGRVTLEQIAERRPGAAGRAARAPRHRVRARALRAPRRGRARPERPAAAARRHRRGRRPAGAVRPVRRRSRPPHRRLPALPGHRRQQHLLGRAGGGRGLRGARRLARRDGRRPGAPVRAASRRAAVAGRPGRQLGGRPPDPARLAGGRLRRRGRRWSAAPSGCSSTSDAPGASVSTRVAGASSAM